MLRSSSRDGSLRSNRESLDEEYDVSLGVLGSVTARAVDEPGAICLDVGVKEIGFGARELRRLAFESALLLGHDVDVLSDHLARVPSKQRLQCSRDQAARQVEGQAIRD